jgi:hypothetical protein
MSDSGSTEDRQRIADLEQEVARLRDELATREGQERAETICSAGGSEDRVELPSRSRAIAIAVGVALVALIGIGAIVVGLSNVIEPFSKKAAQSISPWEPEEGEEAAGSAPGSSRSDRRAAGSAPEPELRAPGL